MAKGEGLSRDSPCPEEPLSILFAIPTLNRSALAGECVRSLQQMDSSFSNWEVLVVDNNSSDNTFALLSKEFSGWPRFRIVEEPERGSSAARNRALRECSSLYIHYLDDECIVPVTFLDNLVSFISESRPAMYGGPVFPRYKSSMPRWYFDELGSAAIRNMAGRSDRISISGANMGFETNCLRDIGGFDTRLGIHGQRVGYGEETDVEHRIISKLGYDRLTYSELIPTYHLALPEKFTVRQLLKEHFLRGRARADIASRPTFRDAAKSTPPQTLKSEHDRPSRLGFLTRLLKLTLGISRRMGYLYQCFRARIR